MAERIRKYIGTTSFQPFVIAMADGRLIRVADRDLILVSPEGSRVIVFQPDEKFDMLDSRYITELIFDNPNS